MIIMQRRANREPPVQRRGTHPIPIAPPSAADLRPAGAPIISLPARTRLIPIDRRRRRRPPSHKRSISTASNVVRGSLRQLDIAKLSHASSLFMARVLTFLARFQCRCGIIFSVQSSSRYPFHCFRRDPSCCFLTENDILIEVEEVEVSGTSLARAT
jgi:hypothetical protein